MHAVLFNAWLGKKICLEWVRNMIYVSIGIYMHVVAEAKKAWCVFELKPAKEKG